MARFLSTRPRRKRSSGCAVKRLLRTSDISGTAPRPSRSSGTKAKPSLRRAAESSLPTIRAHHVDPVALLARKNGFPPISGRQASLWPLPEIPGNPEDLTGTHLKRYAGERHGERIVRLVIEPYDLQPLFPAGQWFGRYRRRHVATDHHASQIVRIMIARIDIACDAPACAGSLPCRRSPGFPPACGKSGEWTYPAIAQTGAAFRTVFPPVAAAGRKSARRGSEASDWVIRHRMISTRCRSPTDKACTWANGSTSRPNSCPSVLIRCARSAFRPGHDKADVFQHRQGLVTARNAGKPCRCPCALLPRGKRGASLDLPRRRFRRPVARRHRSASSASIFPPRFSPRIAWIDCAPTSRSIAWLALIWP